MRMCTKVIAARLMMVVVLAAGKLAYAADEATLPAAAGRTIEFAKDVMPIFHDRCFSCHGPDSQKNGFRLDVRDAALKGGESQKDILPGDSANSPLVRYVSGLVPDKIMPPKGDRLTTEQIGILRAWIDQGAVWPDQHAGIDKMEAGKNHWAFKAVQRPAPPAVKDATWAKNPIDNFIVAALENKGVKPSPEADRPTLARRLYLDLIGLPPSPEVVDEFVNDTGPYAYERIVNQLLASEHFGERWGRHWLDLARYADSDGYEKDLGRPYAWRYRNWVIEALNRDMPYDQFVIEQLAGDLLPNATLEQRVATGFHRNTLTNTEGGVDQEQFRVEAVVDRTNTTGSVLLGLTVGCAQCHDHKYDPILQRDYYGLFAFFNNADEKNVPAALDPELDAYKKAKADFDAQLAKFQQAIDAYKPEMVKSLAEFESKQPVADPEWVALDPVGFLSAGGAGFAKQEDGSLLVNGNASRKDRYMVVANAKLTGVTGFRLEAIPDPSLPNSGPGRATDGNFVLTEFSVTAAQMTDPNSTQPVTIKSAWADHEQLDFPVSAAFDAKQETGWAVGSTAGSTSVAVFQCDQIPGFSDGTTFTFTLNHQYQSQFALGRFRLMVTNSQPESLTLPDGIRAILKTPVEQRTDEQKNALLDYYGKFDPKMRELRAALIGYQRGEPKPPATIAQTIAAAEKPRVTRILTRGDFLRPGDEVQAAAPAIFASLKPRGDTPDRLDLARWIVDPSNPLTARVEVNRVWEHLFDRGLVYTSNDWGTRGEKPSHPELLDWLASEFMAKGWSQKELIRTIVTSATYRQTSRTREDLREIDPLNILLARQSRFRVEAEITRDLFMTVSNLLNPAVGGSSVRPVLPAGVTDLSYAGSVQWPTSAGADRYRRGMYIFFQRTIPFPSLMTFDCPDSNVTCVRRTRSNTPLQALTTLNDPVFFECAQAFGKRIDTSFTGETPERIQQAFRVALGRSPSALELETLARLIADQKANYQKDPEASKKLSGETEGDPAVLSQKAAYVSLARVLMNLDEFMTRE
jgi:mono/diheme cytochrome c family protein